jgi:hypothetical protein
VNKIKITEQVRPKITPVRNEVNTFKVKLQSNKTSIVYTR